MADAGNIATDAFDGVAIWPTLSPEQQARIGAVALELAVGRAIAEHAPDPACRAGMEAERIALQHRIVQALAGQGDHVERRELLAAQR